MYIPTKSQLANGPFVQSEQNDCMNICKECYETPDVIVTVSLDIGEDHPKMTGYCPKCWIKVKGEYYND